ncbi:MAG: DUF86 domain-containing protein [bacterium]
MEAIEKFVEGMDLETLRTDDLRSSAIIRKLEIIGEATKNVPESIRKSYPSIPWREMAGMRDRLIHFYFGIKCELVWNTIKDVIPKIKPLISKILEESEQG